MKKPFWKTITNPVEENEYYVVAKNEDNTFSIYHKFNETVIKTNKYAIVGSTVLYNNFAGESYLYNEDAPQKYGQGNSLATAITIASWGYKKINGKKELVVVYNDEKGYKFVRLVDEQGNLYKRSKKVNNDTQENSVTL